MPLNLLKLQEQLSYEIDNGGMCFGIAHMAIQAIIRDDLRTYIKRIDYLEKVLPAYRYNDENTAIRIIKYKIKLAEKKRLKIFKGQLRASFNDEELILLNIRSWLDGVQIYNGSLKVFPTIYQGNAREKARKLFYKNSYDKQDRSIFLAIKEVGMLTREWMEDLFKIIKDSKEPIAYSISSDGHMIAVGKSSNYNSIYLISHDYHTCITNEENLYKRVLYSFNLDQKINDIALCVCKFSYKEQKIISNKYYPPKYDEHLGKLLSIAMMQNNILVIHECLEQINKSKGINTQVLLAAKHSDGTPGLSLALQYAHAEAIKIYMKTIVESGISMTDKLVLLAAKDSDGTPGLSIAFEDGYAEAIKIYIETIVESRISITDKLVLLAAKRHDGTPGLFMALQKGHAEAIKIYIEIILKSNIIKKQELLAAKMPDGTSGLFMALQKGHAEASKAYTETISESRISIRDKQELLADTFLNKALKNSGNIDSYLTDDSSGEWWNDIFSSL